MLSAAVGTVAELDADAEADGFIVGTLGASPPLPLAPTGGWPCCGCCCGGGGAGSSPQADKANASEIIA
ncbi:MAG: hypothetical protein HOW73_23775 [Polyangiaceae bacterium]|nr:hypothetical protein [Polyangiaceae bacterium]